MFNDFDNFRQIQGEKSVKRHENVSWDIYKVQENGFRAGKNLGPTQGTYKVVP